MPDSPPRVSIATTVTAVRNDNSDSVPDDTLLAVANERFAQQGKIDRIATDVTNTRPRYCRYQEEFAEFCHIVLKDQKDNPTYTTDRIYNFLFYHAYRPKKEPKKPGEGKKRPATGLPTVDTLTEKYPRWFDHEMYLSVFSKFDGNSPQATDLTEDVEYIGFTHLGGIKSALLDGCSNQLKAKVRLDSRVKDLIKAVQARAAIQKRLQKKEKVTAELPHWDLMPQIHRIEQMFWDSNSKNSSMEHIAGSLRDRWCFNDSLQCIIRAESLWKEELSDMLFYKYDQHGEPNPYEILVRVLWDGKTNQKSTGTALLAQCFRHIDPKKCAVGAKALYLFARFRATGEEFDFTDNEWFSVKTAIAMADRGNKPTDNTTPMGSGYYKKKLKDFQKAMKIIFGKLIHFGRKFGSIIPQLDGVVQTEICSLGNWATVGGVVFERHYSAKVPFSAMRSCAGCGKDIGRYYLPRSTIVPSLSLQKMVWPSVENARERLLQLEDHAKYLTAHRFMNAMDQLRIVVLQDAAYFLTQCPDRADHALFEDDMFKTDEFQKYLEQFSKEYKHKTLPENDPTLSHLQLVVPKIGNALHNVVVQSQSCEGMLSDIGKAMREDGEKAYKERCEIYNEMVKRFKAIETQYLSPMFRDVNYIANFVRNGVSGTVGQFMSRTDTATTAASHFHEIVQESSRQNNEPTPVFSPVVPTLCTPSPTVDRNLFPQVQEPTSPPPHSDLRPVPSGKEYSSLLEMYRDWIGFGQTGPSYKALFDDTEWRRIRCPKNSAAMKRMQRMRSICAVVDKHMEEEGTEERDIVPKLDEFEKSIFPTGVPSVFAWTRYESAFRAHDRAKRARLD